LLDAETLGGAEGLGGERDLSVLNDKKPRNHAFSVDHFLKSRHFPDPENDVFLEN